MKIEDILAPYQYDLQNPPRILTSFESELNWFGTKRNARIARVKFELDLSHSYIFWRLEGDDGAWCLSEGGVPHQMTQITDAKDLNNQELLQRINSAIGAKLFCRLFFLEEFKQYVSVKSGFGTFYKSICNALRSFYITWGDIRHWQCSDTKEAFDKILKNRESDAFFSWRTLNLENRSGESGLALFFDNAESYLERCKQFEELFKLVLRRSKWLWKSHKIEWIRAIIEVNSTSISILSSDYSTSKIDDRDKYWIQLIKKFGPISISEGVLKKYYYLQCQNWSVTAHISLPTPSERLEAKLQLLEWAKTHLPPEKYAEVEAMET